MLRVVGRNARLGALRKAYSQSPIPGQPATSRGRSYLPEIGLAALTVAGTGYFLLVDKRAVDHFYAFKDQQESVAPAKPKTLREEAIVVEEPRDISVSAGPPDEDDGSLHSKVWGSNK